MISYEVRCLFKK